MIGATFCSGIGAPEIAAPFIDWRLASEVERFPRAVLAARFDARDVRTVKSPHHMLWGDMAALKIRHFRRLSIPYPAIIVAGTPCQAFSVAGHRRSLTDARGNLTLVFVRLIHAIRKAQQHDGTDKSLSWVVWENVPGVLSTRDNAFGCLLAGFVGADAPLRVPAGNGWPRAGMVAGPRARAAWRVLDAQHFGLAQRRKRVFVVVGFGDGPDPAAVLFEPQVVHGNSAPGGEARQDVAGTLSSRATGGGGLGTDFELAGGVVPALSMCLTAGGMGRQDASSETLIPVISSGTGGFFDGGLGVAHALRGEGFDASEDGTGRGTPLVPVAFDTTQITSVHNRSDPRPGDPCHSLSAAAHPPAVTVALRGREGGAEIEIGSDVATALRASQGGSDKPHVLADMAVRRLTPRECARLQGFPDDHTMIEGYGGAVYKDGTDRAEMAAYLGFESVEAMESFDPPADGPQYKAYGNSMAVPVLRWILGRIVAHQRLMEAAE
jgi:DNA (cytosine-5)-methyltransferase 1